MTAKNLMCKIIAILIFIMLLRYWSITADIPALFSRHMLLGFLALLFLVLNLTSMIGLFQLKKYGFITAYLAIPFSSLYFSVAYIPFLSKLFIASYRPYVTLILNLCLIFITLYLHKNTAKK